MALELVYRTSPNRAMGHASATEAGWGRQGSGRVNDYPAIESSKDRWLRHSTTIAPHKASPTFPIFAFKDTPAEKEGKFYLSPANRRNTIDFRTQAGLK